MLLSILTTIMAASFHLTGLPALLVILVIIAIPVAIGVAIGRGRRRR